jgi:hypothetical protein
MPIQINGSGTLTGLSAGGLPDGSVVADDLASSLDLTGKTVTLPPGAGGKILQVKTTQYDTATSISLVNDGNKELPFYVEITPTSASSRFIVSYQSGGELSDNDHWNKCAALGRANDSGSGFGSISWFEPASPGSRNRGLGIMSISYNASDNSSTPEEIAVHNYVDDPDTTDTLRYYPGVYSNSVHTWYVNRNVNNTDNDGYERFRSWITVMEVVD